MGGFVPFMTWLVNIMLLVGGYVALFIERDYALCTAVMVSVIATALVSSGPCWSKRG